MFADDCVQSLCLREEWQEFIASGKNPEHMNSYILDSWERSKEYGINPFE
jgi:transcriptional regulator of acetoin/glycerol metabolism